MGEAGSEGLWISVGFFPPGGDSDTQDREAPLGALLAVEFSATTQLGRLPFLWDPSPLLFLDSLLTVLCLVQLQAGGI